MRGLTNSPHGSRLMVASLIARLPLAMFSIALLVHIHRLTGSFAIAGAASGAYISVAA